MCEEDEADFTDGEVVISDHANTDNTVNAKYGEIRVAAHGTDGALDTYLRLGAVKSGTAAKYAKLYGEEGVRTDLEPADEDVGLDVLSSDGEDLASLVLTFIDDERDRGSSSFNTLTNKQRREKTAELHTKGGWRDHTDGNRITTTRGDKVEVIYGNYKMRVLGRSQWTQYTDSEGECQDYGSGLHCESSGGITYQYDEVPGQIIDVRRNDDDTTWNVFEECTSGYVINRYHGVMKEWMRGGDVVERFGTQTAFDDERFVNLAAGDADGFSSEDDADFDKPDDTSHATGTAWPSTEKLCDIREQIYAGYVLEKTICNNLTVREGYWDRWVQEIHEHVYAKTYEDEMYYDTFTGVSAAVTMAVEAWGGVFFEEFDGNGYSMKLGMFTDLRIGGAAELNVAPIHLADFMATFATIGHEISALWFDISYSLLSLECEFIGAPLEVKLKETKVDSIKAMQWAVSLVG